MMTALYLLLLLIPCGGCKGSPYFTTQTTAVGQSVYLRCPQEKDLDFEVIIFWIRLDSGTFPEFLAHNKLFNKTPSKTSSSGHLIITKEEAGMFVLQISQVQKSDMAVYYCFRWTKYVQDMIFLKGIFLQVKDSPGAEPSVITVTGTDSSQFGPSMTSHCSVLSHSKNQTYSDGHKVYWFQTGTNDTYPSFIYTREEWKKSIGGSVQKCVNGFSENISSSDTENYLCGVATCAEIFTGNTQKDACRCDLQSSINIATSVALAISLFILIFLTYYCKTKGCLCCTARPQTLDEISNNVQQKEDDSLVYSAPTIVTRKSGKSNQRGI